MRTRILYILLVAGVMLITSSSQGQAFLGGIAFGANVTQVDGDEMYGFKKIGFNAGVSATFPFTDQWSISIEAAFMQKGSYQKYPHQSNPNKSLPYYDLRLNYLDVPLLVHFTDKGFLNFGLGMSWGRLVGVKEVEWGKTIHSSITNSPYSRDDINGIVSIQFPIYQRLKFNFRYAYSFAKIRTRAYENLSGETWTRDQYNHILSFRLVYVFNEKIEKKEN